VDKASLPFDKRLIIDMSVTLAQLLRLFGKYDDIRLYAFGSYPCENFFSYLRMISHKDNSSDRAIQAI
jgi:hypothetical protein